MARPDTEIWEDGIFFQCNCTLDDHIVLFEVVDLDAGMERRHHQSIQLSITPMLNPEKSFFKRLWIALRYIVKKEPRYSRHFDSVVVHAGEDLDKLEKMIRRVTAASRLRKLSNERRDASKAGGKSEE
jgi:hypothetical protein